MSNFNNLAGTSFPSFQIGKNGGSITQGTISTDIDLKSTTATNTVINGNTLITTTEVTNQGSTLLGNAATGAGLTHELHFQEQNSVGTNYVGFKAPDSLAANQIWTLPNADGIAGGLLTTDGAGGTTWQTGIAGLGITNPTGTDRQVLITNGDGTATWEHNLDATFNAQTGTTYTLVLTDATKLVTMDNAANTILTIPPNSTTPFRVGTVINFLSLNVGVVTFASTDTIISKESMLTITTQYSACSLLKTAATTWVLFGDIA
jgi:hypothetical protein